MIGRRSRRTFGTVLLLITFLIRPDAAGQARARQIGAFDAAEARQGVAVDATFFYAVSDRAIGKYRKSTGELVGRWEGDSAGPIIHLDSGMVKDGRLYAAHSNYPGVPMTSSIEVWDCASMKHVDSHSFGVHWGSATWVDDHDGFWWVGFANYSRVWGPSQVPYGNKYWTTVVKFDRQWRWLEAWTLPESVLERFGAMSNSGGSWGPDGLLYLTGHDAAEMYAMRLPEAGSMLELVEIVPVGIAGQGLAWDRSDPGILYGIRKEERKVTVHRVEGMPRLPGPRR